MPTYHMGWGNPETELMGKQKRECHGCIHKHTEKAFGIEINFCDLNKKHMHKCERYTDKKEKINES